MLVCFHGGCLWLEQNILVDVELIALTTRLPIDGVNNPAPFFAGKDQDVTLTNRIKDKYELTKDKRGFFVASINDMVVRFANKVLFSKLLKKMRPNQCTTRTIVAAE